MNKTLLIISSIAMCIICSCNTQNDSPTTNQEAAPQEMTLKEALQLRHSVRNFSDKALTDEQVMDLLWAANGISHGTKRTAPSGVNAQDISLYVCSANGVSIYQAQDSTLQKVTDQDIRPIFRGRNQFIDTAPITILLISDLSKFGEPRPNNHNWEMALMDAGCVSQNISLWCTATGLATVCCAPPMPNAGIQQALGLDSQHISLIYHPIGYEAE
jgi:nitroreductase